ncbi:PEP-CTERM sorting domain-containing protein [Duganella sp. sic0402]|nr:PEP-CTERM sorting domain-containing protein [Duganella sp. sic0402]
MRFFYDADFWGNNAVFASGNTISLYLNDDFDIQTSLHTATRRDILQSGESALSVFAVRKDGGPIQASIFSLTKTFFELDAHGSSVSAYMEGSVFGGELSNGHFVNLGSQGLFSGSASIASAGTAYSGMLTSIAVTDPIYASFSAVGISTQLLLGIGQLGYGSVRADMSSISYTFDVSTIPEPHSYVMAMAGLGLVGFAARRRKRA